MKFIVTRTSDGEPPCDGAIQEKYIRIDTRWTDAPEKLGASKGESKWWYEAGRNHRIENGHIKRDFDDTAWFIEMETLSDLEAFCRKHDAIVMQPSRGNESIMQIEIYDDYRE